MDPIEDLERYRTQNELSKAEMARLFAVEPQRYNNWVYRGSLPKSFYARAEEVLEGSNLRLPEAPGQAGRRPDRFYIPRLDVEASMGSGLAVQGEDVVEEIAVSKEWLRRYVNATAPTNLALLDARGDSMEGTFSDGDLLLVDRGISEVKVDAVYVLALDDELFIKRLQRRPDGTMLMLSDNPKYPPYELKNGDLSTFQVLGRVLLAWNARRL